MFTRRFVLLLVGFVASACSGLHSVDGERASSGTCPTGEVCSKQTPNGLQFVGQSLFDRSWRHLGPVAVGGTFELGMRGTTSSETLPRFIVRAEPEDAVRVVRGNGVFGPTRTDGTPLERIDDYLVLSAEKAGEVMIRIVDPQTLELFDRLPIEILPVDHISVVNARDERRNYLYQGCEEMLGVRFTTSQDRRVIDQSFSMEAVGAPMTFEPRFWDCNVVTVPEDATQVAVRVQTAYATEDIALPVRSLESDNRSQCPAVSD